MASIGIDIGSTCAKTIVLDQAQTIIWRDLRPTGWSSVETANQIKKDILAEGIDIAACNIVATGYGRVSVPYATKNVTEISCHAKGAAYIFGVDNLVVVDIGGQDTKIIHIENGMVSNFLMNDKCSAGTGRFLDVMANTLGVDTNELCRLARKGSGISISSMCTVFAESEVISHIGRGESKQNIAFAVVDSIVSKVASQAAKFDVSSTYVGMTGGLCDFDYLVELMGQKMKSNVHTNSDARYAGAIGAALLAGQL